MEHPWIVWDVTEKVWWNPNKRGSQSVIQWKRGRTWTRSGFPSKDIVKSVIGCRPISSRLMTVRLRASPFNVTIVQVYTTTSSYDDSDVNEFYRKLQSLVDQTPKQDILVVQGDWNAKAGEDAQDDWGEVCGPSCDPETNDRGLNLLDFATYNNLVLANTLGHPEGGHGTAQMEHITTRLTTSWWRNGSVQVLKLPEREHSQLQMLEATITWWWWLSRHTLRIQGNQPCQESGLTPRSWMIQQWWVLSRQL